MKTIEQLLECLKSKVVERRNYLETSNIWEWPQGYGEVSDEITIYEGIIKWIEQ